MSRVKKCLVIIPSFVAAAIVFGVKLAEADLQIAAIFAYGAWAWYWGLALGWPVYAKLARYEGKEIDAVLMKFWYPIFYFFLYLFGSLLVGFLGGGIFQFIKVVRSPSPEEVDAALEQGTSGDE